MARLLIGVTPHMDKDGKYVSLRKDFLDAMESLGCLPVILPMTDSEGALEAMLEQMDGFLFSGGEDVHPRYFGQEILPGCGTVCPVRDRMELALLKKLAAGRKPVLGVCRGLQVLNVALGGAVFQDVYKYSGLDPVILHNQPLPAEETSHQVSIERDSLLYQIVGKTSLMVNSLHHQAVSTPAPRMAVTARAPDGLIEAIELKGHPFYLGVQWHPERLWRNHEEHLQLFRAFAEAARA